MPQSEMPLAPVVLRAPEPADVNLIYIWENSYDEAHSSLRTGKLSRFQISNYIEKYDGEIYTLGSLRFMIDFDGATVGTIDVFDFDHRARHAFVGIYVTPSARRKGVAAAALREVETIMRRNVSMYSLLALVAADNQPSLGLFRGAGYEQAGLLHGWLAYGSERVDAVLFQHIL